MRPFKHFNARTVKEACKLKGFNIMILPPGFVPCVAERVKDNVFGLRFGLHPFEEFLERKPSPFHVGNRPTLHAVEIQGLGH